MGFVVSLVVVIVGAVYFNLPPSEMCSGQFYSKDLCVSLTDRTSSMATALVSSGIISSAIFAGAMTFPTGRQNGSYPTKTETVKVPHQ